MWILGLGFLTSARLRIGAGTTGALKSSRWVSVAPEPTPPVTGLLSARPRARKAVAELHGMQWVLPSYGRVA